MGLRYGICLDNFYLDNFLHNIFWIEMDKREKGKYADKRRGNEKI